MNFIQRIGFFSKTYLRVFKIAFLNVFLFQSQNQNGVSNLLILEMIFSKRKKNMFVNIMEGHVEREEDLGETSQTSKTLQNSLLWNSNAVKVVLFRYSDPRLGSAMRRRSPRSVNCLHCVVSDDDKPVPLYTHERHVVPCGDVH